jgi:hypothetical protein
VLEVLSVLREAEVQGHNSGGSGLYCNFSGTELNTYAEAF